MTDSILCTVAKLFKCRTLGHPLGPVASRGLWIAAATVHVKARLVAADRVFDNVPTLMLA